MPLRWTASLWLAVFCLCIARPAASQILDARRLGMGGVVLSEGGGSSAQNVAYRAVLHGGGFEHHSIPLPLGLIQFAADPPTFDTGDSTFNAFAIADLALNPPYLLQIVKPHEVESDIHIDVAKNALKVDLGDLKDLFEHRSKKLGNVLRSPDI